MFGIPYPVRVSTTEDEWLWGWDATPGIVSVWAEPDGRALVWRRPGGGALLREEARFRPWLLLGSLDDLAHLGGELRPEGRGGAVGYRELDGPGELRFVASAADLRALSNAVLRGASRRLERAIGHLRELEPGVLSLPPEEQYLVATGRTYFGGLAFDELRRVQLDLETTGLDAAAGR